MAAVALDVKDLSIAFPTRRGRVHAVDGMSYQIAAGRTLGLVGESGCGKSVGALAVMGLVDPPGQVTAARIRLGHRDLAAMGETDLARLRGNRIAMIFQEPMTALNPVYTIGDQVAETLVVHRGLGSRAARAATVALLDRVGLPAPDKRARNFPHQLSGGMRQRVMIAMALSCHPDVLIADEPTTALDVTVQAQVLELILELQDEIGMAVLMISHDLGVVSEVADDIAVMYAGRIVEQAPAEVIFVRARHPYTQGLLATAPAIGAHLDRLPSIAGSVPDLAALPVGCAFRDRCPLADQDCAEAAPTLVTVAEQHSVACHKQGP